MPLPYSVLLVLFLVLVLVALTHIFVESVCHLGLHQIIYLIATRQMSHYIQKRNLVSGDLVLIRYRGKYRKAYITGLSVFSNTVQAKFLDRELNIDILNGNWYPLSRVFIPDFMGRGAKVLYSDLED